MKGLHGWLRQLEHNETAVLSSLLSELDKVINSETGSGEQVAAVILKDAFLTSKIIRVANSVLFNPNELPVTTVSRAVINIGFDNIRSICLSIKVLETLMDSSNSPLMLSMLVRSVHAASQAKSLCPNLNVSAKEEVFVATLLFHLVELLVLGQRDEEVKQFSRALTAHSTDQEKDRAAEKFLGVSITRLAKSLIKHWRMQGLILEVINAKGLDTESRTVEAIRLGNEISRAALLGWDSAEYKAVIEKVAEFQGSTENQIHKQILKVADDTAEMISSFGRKNLVDFLPTSKRAAKPIQQEIPADADVIESDSNLRREIHNKLSELLRTEININEIIKLVLNGLKNGVGLQRVSLAIFDKAQSKFVTKHHLGKGTEHWKEKFVIFFDKHSSSFLFQLFQYEQVVWADNEQYRSISSSLKGEFSSITGQNEFFIAPLKANSKMIGFIYADMGESKQLLNVKVFDEFNQFISKVNLALDRLAKRK